MIHSAFIEPKKHKNEIAEYLHRLNIKRKCFNKNDKYIIAYFEDDVPCYKSGNSYTDDLMDHIVDGAINCRNNIDMFLAIVALSNDHDFMQWFKNNNDTWIMSTAEHLTIPRNSGFKKAEIAEIIDHFKDTVFVLVKQEYEDIESINVFRSMNDIVDFLYENHNDHKDKKESIAKSLYIFRSYMDFSVYISKIQS